LLTTGKLVRLVMHSISQANRLQGGFCLLGAPPGFLTIV
jgi:hypothetical protein